MLISNKVAQYFMLPRITDVRLVGIEPTQAVEKQIDATKGKDCALR
jgi:hypothetical protein